jgi:hypothetical protein
MEETQYYFQAAKQDTEGHLYQLMTELDQATNSYRLKFTRDGERQSEVELALKDISTAIKIEEAIIEKEEKEEEEEGPPVIPDLNPLRSMSVPVLQTEE